jgi:ankyrin repeat protein
MVHPVVFITALFSKNAALRLAAQAGDKDAVRTLLELGANANAGALHRAAQRGGASIALQLIDFGANVNQRDGRGCQPLHYAAYGMRPETAAALLERRAEPNAKGPKGWTALHMASLGNEKTLREVLPRISAPHSLSAAIRERRRRDPRFVNLAKLLLSQGADVRVSTDAGDTPLHLASHWGLGDLLIRA